MFNGVQTIIIPFERKTVYEAAETYPYFVSFFSKNSKVIEQNDVYVKVEVHTKLLGFFPTKWEGIGKKQRYQSIYYTQTQGLFKGLTAVWNFEDLNNGTRVSIRSTFSKLGLLDKWLLGKFVVESTTQRILAELKHYLEKH